MKRAIVPINIVIQLDNPVQQPAYGAPVLMTAANMLVDEAGASVYQPAHTQMPAAPEDFGDDMLQAINHKLRPLGLRIERDGGEA